MVEQGAGTEKELEHEDGERRSSERGDHPELQEHRKHDLEGMEPRARGHVHVQVGVMHAMQPPQNRHGMKEDVLEVNGEIQEDHGNRNDEPGG